MYELTLKFFEQLTLFISAVSLSSIMVSKHSLLTAVCNNVQQFV
jgi:hypothetical protein